MGVCKTGRGKTRIRGARKYEIQVNETRKRKRGIKLVITAKSYVYLRCLSNAVGKLLGVNNLILRVRLELYPRNNTSLKYKMMLAAATGEATDSLVCSCGTLFSIDSAMS